MRALGGGYLFLRPNDALAFSEASARSIIPLLQAQPYVSGAGLWNGEKVDVQLDAFRNIPFLERTNLADAHLTAFDLPMSERDQAWLAVSGTAPQGGAVFARSTVRVGINDFWRVARARFPNARFLGTQEEWSAISAMIGPIDHEQTVSFLDLAIVIAGSECVVANQSAPYAIAEGFKVTTIQEVDTWSPNCVFARSNAFYVNDSSALMRMASGSDLVGNGQTVGIATQPLVEREAHHGRLSEARLRGTSAIVLTQNSLLNIHSCLESLVPTLTYDDELIVVDNASTDGTREALLEWSQRSRFLLVLKPEDTGIASGINLGILQSRGSYIAVVSPEILVAPGWQSRLAGRYGHPLVSAVGPLFDDGPPIPPGTHRTASARQQGLQDRGEPALAVGILSQRTKLLRGACMMLDRTSLQEFGLFDEAFTRHCQDLEMCWRLRSFGRHLLIAQDVMVRQMSRTDCKFLDPVREAIGLKRDVDCLRVKLQRAYPEPAHVSIEELWDIDELPGLA